MRTLLILFLCGGLLACSGSVEEQEEPAPLLAINEEIAAKLKWRKRIAADAAVNVKLGVYLHDGVLYAANYKGRVYAVDLNNGRTLWSQDLDVPVSSGIGGSDKHIIFGTRDAEVILLSQKDGKLVWRSRVSSEVLATPVLQRSTAVVRTGDGKIYGLAIDSGYALWNYGRKVPPLSLYGNSDPVVSGNFAYAGFDNGRVAAVSLSDGKVRWEMQLGVPSGRSELERMVDVDATPVLRDGVIYAVSYQGAIAAIDARNGRKMWVREFSSHSGLAVDAHNVYVSDTGGVVWALDRKNGATFWKQDKLKNRQLSAPALHENYIAVGDLEGYMHWISREDGRIVARLQVDENRILLQPQSSGKRLITKSQSGEISSLELKPIKRLFSAKP